MIKITADNYKEFLTCGKYVLILCDATWNNNKELAKQFKEIADKGGDGFVFGELDTDDKGLWDFLKEWKVTNVPSVLYLWNSISLKKTMIGGHNIKSQITSMLLDEITRG